MESEKIGVLIDKIKPDYLLDKIENLFAEMGNSEKKNVMVDMVSSSIKKKGKNININELEKQVYKLKST